jgi:hypothetical protein
MTRPRAVPAREALACPRLFLLLGGHVGASEQVVRARPDVHFRARQGLPPGRLGGGRASEGGQPAGRFTRSVGRVLSSQSPEIRGRPRRRSLLTRLPLEVLLSFCVTDGAADLPPLFVVEHHATHPTATRWRRNRPGEGERDLFRARHREMAQPTQGDQVLQPVVETFSERYEMMNVQGPAVVFGGHAAVLADGIADAHGRSGSGPFRAVRAFPVQPTRFGVYPSRLVVPVNEEPSGAVQSQSEGRHLDDFAAAAGARHGRPLGRVARLELLARLGAVCATSERVIGAGLHRTLAGRGSARPAPRHHARRPGEWGAAEFARLGHGHALSVRPDGCKDVAVGLAYEEELGLSPQEIDEMAAEAEADAGDAADRLLSALDRGTLGASDGANGTGRTNGVPPGNAAGTAAGRPGG